MPSANARLRIHVLASGSKGNASLVENVATGEGILIDCGICKRDVLSRSVEAGFDLSKLKAVLVTHEHSDHTKGLKVLYRELAKRGLEVPLYANQATFANSKPIQEASELTEVVGLDAEDQLSLAGMQVLAFGTSHDAASSFGFRIWAENDVLGFMTDTGVVTGAAHEALQGCRILALEANHDPIMLKNGPYPRALQERVSSEFGHLSNEQASEKPSASWPGRGDCDAHLREQQHLPPAGGVLARGNPTGKPFCGSGMRLPATIGLAITGAL